MKTETRGYLALWAATFLQAIDDAWSKDKLLREPAREWIHSDRQSAGSFCWLCSVFDLDPMRTRSSALGSRTAVSELRARVTRQNKLRSRQARGEDK